MFLFYYYTTGGMIIVGGLADINCYGYNKS